MKKKKLERQLRERQQKEEKEKQEIFNNLQTVTMKPRNNEVIEYLKEYSWSCPNHEGTYTYSKKINEQWGHPTNLVFCAVCCTYHKFEILKTS